MSYHLSPPRRIARAATAPVASPVAPSYSLLPLAQAPAPPTNNKARDLLTAIVVVIVIAALLWWIDQQNRKSVKPNRSRATKQSTAAMAKNLYKRLEDRGGVNGATMNSLRQLGRNA